MAEGNGSDKKKVKRPSALKRDIQHEKRRLQNKAFKAQVNTALRNFKNSLSSKDGIIEKLNTVFSLMDKGVKKRHLQNQQSRTR